MQVQDQLGRIINLSNDINKIVSLVPSITHILAYLGFEDQIMGRTKFCIYPQNLSAEKLGGTKNPNIEKILDLQADLILMNKEENRKEDVEALEQKAPVYVSDINTIKDLYCFLDDIGQILSCSSKTNQLKDEIEAILAGISQPSRPVKFLYFIWKSPYYLAGKSTYIDHLFERVGWENQVIHQKKQDRYPELEDGIWHEEVDYILLSSEPYPFKDKHISEMQKNFPKAKIRLVPGEVFSWYGPFIFELEKTLIQITQ